MVARTTVEQMTAERIERVAPYTANQMSEKFAPGYQQSKRLNKIKHWSPVRLGSEEKVLAKSDSGFNLTESVNRLHQPHQLMITKDQNQIPSSYALPSEADAKIESFTAFEKEPTVLNQKLSTSKEKHF